MNVEYTYDSNTPLDIRDLWQTPQEVFDFWNRVDQFTLDVAASDHNHLVQDYLTKEDDALSLDWSESNWCNPPYSDISSWVDKAIEQVWKGNYTVMLVPSNIDTRWFSSALDCERCRIAFYTGKRIHFIRADTGEQIKGNPRGSMFLIFDPRYDFNNEDSDFKFSNIDGRKF
ncbi:N-6-adenine-methyltransferase [Trabzonvirus APT65]|uniref:N-6-adenine-methyltransferase n=1 Tax=Aeromonas phage APT65 TaxID=2982914 RepID=A0A9E8K4K3_9CAUD|nr:N-6-adenine-methyltransferase [Aeromonas phage APT65]